VAGIEKSKMKWVQLGSSCTLDNHGWSIESELCTHRPELLKTEKIWFEEQDEIWGKSGLLTLE
jgi:hypothetical protein